MQRAVTTTLRALTPRDLPALHALSAEAGWPHRVQDWAMVLSLGEGLAACAPDGTILGTAMQWRWSATCATIGMVLVAQAQQGKGLGRQLMQGLLAADPTRAVMLNATLAGLGLYERLGFRPIGMVRQHQGIVTAPRVPLRLALPADVPALIALDEAAFGTPRSALIETLMATADIHVLERGGKLRGFAVRRTFGHGEAIGPVVAETEDDATALAAAVLRPGFQRIDIPAEAASLAAWLTQAGLPAVDEVTVMTRGAWPHSAGGVRRFALASQALG
jgi:predicted N-acetyltransferase YhbS